MEDFHSSNKTHGQVKVRPKTKFSYFGAMASSRAKGQSLIFCHEYNLDQENVQEH